MARAAKKKIQRERQTRQNLTQLTLPCLHWPSGHSSRNGRRQPQLFFPSALRSSASPPVARIPALLLPPLFCIIVASTSLVALSRSSAACAPPATGLSIDLHLSLQCDETHPTCNNCRKSKRECLGYDPIFRQQAGTPTSGNVQPASSSLSPATEPSGLASSTVGPSTPRLVNSYGSQSPMLPSVYATGSAPSTPSIPPNSYIPPLSTPGSSSAVSVKQEYGYGYSSNIDPAVRSMSGTHNHQMSLSGSDSGYLRGMTDPALACCFWFLSLIRFCGYTPPV